MNLLKAIQGKIKPSYENKAARAVWYVLSPCVWVLMVLGSQVPKVMLRLCSCATPGTADECMHMTQPRACWNCRISDAAADQGIGIYMHINI